MVRTTFQDPDGLNPRQRKFCEEYVIDHRGGAAARRAGYLDKSADVTATRLLKQAKIRHAIERLRADREIRTHIEGDRVLAELARLAFFDPRGLFGDGGYALPVDQWPDEVAAAVSAIELAGVSNGDGVARYYPAKIRFWNKNTALDNLMKHLGLYAPDRHEWSGPEGGPVQVEMTDAQRLHYLVEILARLSPGDVGKAVERLRLALGSGGNRPPVGGGPPALGPAGRATNDGADE